MVSVYAFIGLCGQPIASSDEEMKAVFDDVLCPLFQMPSYLQRSERKQRLVSEGTAITKSEEFPVPSLCKQRGLEPEIECHVVGE